MTTLMSAVFQPLKCLRSIVSSQNLLTVPSIVSSNNLVKPESYLMSTIRTKVRCYFPRPNEVKRVRRHGWEHRMSTPNGRKIIMRRILKGRYVLSH